MDKCRHTTIYIGLNDAFTLEQRFDTEKYVSILKSVCRHNNVAFSFDLLNGGYIHEDGSYVEEQTLSLILVDTPPEVIEQIANDLCIFFRQESVMVVSADADVFFVQNEAIAESMMDDNMRQLLDRS